ncbi:hypothetical protein [Actinocorallia longicatena]|uniref:Peptidoglycan recognition protein family domain-containing protein n=1 Tax=Actinocorallia longicatena TaxID=111803 RepID=A0ABP6QQ32_9ACTN
MKLVSRSAWGARSPRAQASYLASTRGVKVHYTGGKIDVRTEDDHGRCAPIVRQIQNLHMDDNGWNDIGYSFVACPHRYVFEGRGLHRLPSANGAGLNSGHYAVLGLVGNSGLTVPTDDMLHGIRDAIDHVRSEGAAGTEIKGHRDGYSTDCPGPKLYAWVKAGAPRPAEKEPEPTLRPVLDLGLSAEVTVPPGERVSLPWNVEYADPSDVHATGPAWFPKTSEYHYVTLATVVTGQSTNEKVKLIISEYEQSGANRITDRLGEDKIGNGTRIEFALSGLVWMNSQRSYRVDLVNYGTVAAVIPKATLRVVR